MAKVVVKSKAKKIKRKFPVEIVAPEYLNSVLLGKSEVTDLSQMAGKTAKINMMYVTGNIKNQNVRLVFRVNDVSSGLAKTEVSGYFQIPYYLGRFVKKGSNLVEDSFVATTKDGRKVRIQPFIVTKMNTSSMALSSIRARSRELIEKEVSSAIYDDFIMAVITGKIQNLFRNELKKIYPLKSFEFRDVELQN